ncbi:hypothetical protein EON65_20245 [archaeon]|nr:MAG: hypothetical protein EON65_20245 [archaeon]
MKLYALIKFGESQTRFTISCGTGSKSFKWLGNVASQRFSTCVPNGSLRRMEALCSGSDNAQHQTKSITTPLGDSPHPSELLQDHLHDGDEVVIELYDVLSINNVTQTAMPSPWTTMAYSLSQYHLNSDMGARSLDEDGEESEGESVSATSESNFSLENIAKSQAHINFVKVLLKSQQIDIHKVDRAVEKIWPKVEKALSKVNPRHIPIIKSTFADYWDLLKDVYDSYAGNDNVLTKENYLAFIEDSGIFPLLQSNSKGILIYNRTCVHASCTPAEFKLDCFLVSLLFAAQLKYNDTLDPRNSLSTAYDAVERIVSEHLVPLAHKLECLSVLKSAFFSDECMMKIRFCYDNLQDIFGKSAAKLRDVPSTITVKEFSELLYNAGLLEAQNEEERCKQLLSEVRIGTLYGREVEFVESKADASYETPMTEFTFAEFVEAVARAAYYQHMKVQSKAMEEYQESIMTSAIIEQMIRGIVAMADFALGKNVRAQSSKDKKPKPQRRKEQEAK